MVHRRPHRSPATPARLDALLAEAFDCASKLRKADVAEAILCALELHAEVTGQRATRDAVYLAIARTVGVGRRGQD